MSSLKISLLCLGFVFTACNSSSRSAEKNPIIKKTDTSNRTCIPESELLATDIIGGQVVQQSDTDSKVVVMLVSGSQPDAHMCTSVVIGKKVILTAAHCIVGTKMNTYVSFHSSISCESGYNKNIHIKGVKETIVNEEYDPASKPEDMIGDIALVILEEEIPEGYQIFNIADPDQLDSSDEMYLYGYGITGSNLKDAGLLRKTILSRTQYEVMAESKKIKIDQSAGTGICKGDSGGPSFIKNTKGEMQIIGINSYVVGPDADICSKNSFQTLAHSYKAWIDSKLSAINKNKK